MKVKLNCAEKIVNFTVKIAAWHRAAKEKRKNRRSPSSAELKKVIYSSRRQQHNRMSATAEGGAKASSRRGKGGREVYTPPHPSQSEKTSVRSCLKQPYKPYEVHFPQESEVHKPGECGERGG